LETIRGLKSYPGYPKSREAERKLEITCEAPGSRPEEYNLESSVAFTFAISRNHHQFILIEFILNKVNIALLSSFMDV